MAKQLKTSGSGLHRAVLGTAFCVLSDVIHWLFDDLNSILRAVLATPSETSIKWVLGLYLTYTLSLWLVSRLHEDIPLRTVKWSSYDEGTGRHSRVQSNWPDIIFLYPSFGFGVLMIMTCAEVSGLHLRESPIGEDWQDFAL